MDVQETISKARDAVSVERVYGDPYERDGVVVIPAASVSGGGGGGSGEGPEAGQVGGGAGFGLSARPVGAYVIDNGRVHWEPAVDVSRIAQLGVAALMLAILILGRRR